MKVQYLGNAGSVAKNAHGVWVEPDGCPMHGDDPDPDGECFCSKEIEPPDAAESLERSGLFRIVDARE